MTNNVISRLLPGGMKSMGYIFDDPVADGIVLPPYN